MNPTYHPQCSNCALHSAVTNPGIGGDGDTSPDILIVLEAPTRNEDVHNIAAYPSGAAALLRDICQKMNEEGQVTFRFSYVVRCACLEETAAGWLKPRPPTTKEITKCIPWLHEEVAMCKPKAIVLMGGTVVKAVLGSSAKLGDVRGRAIWRGDQVYVPTYHPSNMLENKSSQGKDYKQHSADQYIEWVVQDLILAARVANGEQKQPEDVEWTVAQNEADAMHGLYECSKLGPDEFFGVDIENNCWDDTEVDSIFKKDMRITHLGLSWKRNQALVIPMSFMPDMPQPAKFRPSHKWQRDFVHALWKAKARHAGQNYAYDEVAMHLRYGVTHYRPYHDTILMHHLLWSHLPHALAELARVWTPWGGYEEEVKQTVAKMPRAKRGF